MYKQFFPLLIINATLVACGASNSSNSSALNRDTATPPVETRSPNTDYKPSFSGQTRAAGIVTTTPYESKVLSSTLNRPWGITALP
jgi:hypothetical protein